MEQLGANTDCDIASITQFIKKFHMQLVGHAKHQHEAQHEHVSVRVVVIVFVVCLAVVTLIPCTHRMDQDVRVFVSFHPMVIAVHA